MITQADIELYFNGTVELDSTFATKIINQNTAYVSQLAGRPFGQNSVTEEVNVYECSDRIQLLYAPIISITSVYVNESDEFSPAWSQVTDYIIEDADLGIIKLKTPVSAGLKRLKVEYTYGVDPIPEQANKLILDLCVMDVLKMIVNAKAGNDDSDMIDLGAIRLRGSYSGVLANLAQLRAEINELTKNLYMSKSKFRL